MRDFALEKTHLPGSSFSGALQLLADLHWNVRIEESDAVFYVLKGETIVLKTDSRDAVDTLLYGAALAYLSLPAPIFEQYTEYLKRHFGEPQ